MLASDGCTPAEHHVRLITYPCQEKMLDEAWHCIFCRGNSSRIILYHIYIYRIETVHLTLIVRIYTRATSRLLDDMPTISKTLNRVEIEKKP